MDHTLTRRSLLVSAIGGAGTRSQRSAAAANVQPVWRLPIGFPGELPGNDLYIKHGYGCENPEHFPGLLHTGENWYGIKRNATEADVLAVAGGEVVYADFDYPGRVVIVQHGPDIFSVYGHLSYELAIEAGQRVVRGERIGSPLAYPGDLKRSHLHFEIRMFYLSDIINGERPSHGFTCGFQCPPGPGYWPLDASEHPSDLGWLNPTHAIARWMFPDGPGAAGASVIVSSTPSNWATPTWSSPPWKADAGGAGELTLHPGERFPLVQVAAGPADSRGMNANAYRLWYRIDLRDGSRVWAQAAVADSIVTGLDGEPAAVQFNFIPNR